MGKQTEALERSLGCENQVLRSSGKGFQEFNTWLQGTDQHLACGVKTHCLLVWQFLTLHDSVNGGSRPTRRLSARSETMVGEPG